MRLLVQLAETLQARVIDTGERMNFPKTHHLSAGPPAVANADVILGMEMNDFWALVNQYVDNGSHGHGFNQQRMKAGTKLISINSVDLNTKANYQDFQRFQAVDIAMAADAEATLPVLIEEVKRAIRNDKKAAIEKRGEAAKKAHAEAQVRTRQAAAIAWDAQPISTARLCAEIWAQIKDLDWSLVAQSGNVSNWPHRLWKMEKHHHWLGQSGGYGLGYGAAGRGRRGARQPRSRPLLGHDPGRRRPDVRAGRAVDRGEAQNPDADGDAQQSRLPSGADARAAAVELPQSRGEPRRRHRPDRHQHHESRTSSTTSSRSRWAGGGRDRSRTRRISGRR